MWNKPLQSISRKKNYMRMKRKDLINIMTRKKSKRINN